MSRISVKDIDVRNRIYNDIENDIVKKILGYKGFLDMNTFKFLFTDNILKLSQELIKSEKDDLIGLEHSSTEIYENLLNTGSKVSDISRKVDSYVDEVNGKTTNHLDELQSRLSKQFSIYCNDMSKDYRKHNEEIEEVIKSFKETIRKQRVEFSDMKLEMADRVGTVEKMEEHIMQLKQQLIECREEMSKMSLAYGTVIQQFSDMQLNNNRQRSGIRGLFGRNRTTTTPQPSNPPPLPSTTTTTTTTSTPVLPIPSAPMQDYELPPSYDSVVNYPSDEIEEKEKSSLPSAPKLEV